MYIRTIKLKNYKHQEGTNDGPNREYKFSASEESIYNLVAIASISIEGVSGNVFGLGAAKQNEDPLNKTYEFICVNVVMPEENKNTRVEAPN